ncbi:DUF1398 family protein [Vaginisenegalia massiliensis]|uniref:DUF1398 family protein n=1 Tax=Vaginisenegalia massiliensis TaxID=2058294 RepID=UPI000F5297A0|nr:DUF1398 family protein [Vaginisenegalia massiliensis]
MEYLLSDIEKIMLSEEKGRDFPQLIQALKAKGINRYDFSVLTGRYTFSSDKGSIEATLNGQAFPIAEHSAKEVLKSALEESQKGKLNFSQFIEWAGKAGVKYWLTDLEKMQVSYFDNQESLILTEAIPQV